MQKTSTAFNVNSEFENMDVAVESIRAIKDRVAWELEDLEKDINRVPGASQLKQYVKTLELHVNHMHYVLNDLEQSRKEAAANLEQLDK